MGGDISQIKRLYAAITCSNFERTLPPPYQAENIVFFLIKTE
jgi:hypothetical protein